MTARRLPRGVVPEVPGPGQESCWDYPRPPALVRVVADIIVEFGGGVVAHADHALVIKETSHPPTYYLAPESWTGVLRPVSGMGTVCEWKGSARYLDVVGADGVTIAPQAAWVYDQPWAPYTELARHISVYPGRMDRVTVEGELVRAQPGGFYGGWITDAVVGPFKGGPGSHGW